MDADFEPRMHTNTHEPDLSTGTAKSTKKLITEYFNRVAQFYAAEY
jgi:hypothetical protein